MCGIAGFITPEKWDFNHVLNNMVQKLHHRGPDSKGTWCDADFGLGLGHARLSIIDLTPTGHQPMQSASGRYMMVFNGEIYNHLALRKELEKNENISWRGTSDTETLLYGFEIWGLDATVKKCNGMFAIALWDKKEKSLTLVRDRMGEKPLYYGFVGKSFVFASELAALKAIPQFSNPIDKGALALFMSYAAVPEPFSIYSGINKLPSGGKLTWSYEKQTPEITQYWSVESLTNRQLNPLYTGSASDAVDTLETLLTDAVNLQTISDVPIGAFLSGGVDSSCIAALMQSVSSHKIDTFSIGFDKPEYNEAQYAKEVAKHLGTQHHETYVTDREALDIVPQLSSIYSEPFSESSQIPTFMVAKIARQKVTVSLSGDAGDELFGGYSRYQLANNTWNKLDKIPKVFRKTAYAGINALPYDFWYSLLLPLKGKRNKINLPVNFADKLFKGLPMLMAENRKAFYHKGLMNHNPDLQHWLPGVERPMTKFDSNAILSDNFFDEMMATDLITYLPNNNLAKVDRAAMASSLETRVPLLDHRVVQFALSLPVNYKIQNGTDKWVLRQVLYKHVPKHLIERPKMGFAVPLEDWLRGPLKDWGAALLDPRKIKEGGFFDADFITKKWQEFQSGKRNWQGQLWDVIMFQAWLENNKL